MLPAHDLLLFALAALGMVLTPGPNMGYLLSRSVCQGRAAGAVRWWACCPAFSSTSSWRPAGCQRCF